MAKKKKRNVLIVAGSPREKGNSSTLANRAAHGVRKAGAEAHVIRLHGLDIRPCRACDTCQKTLNYACVQHDAMKGIYDVLRKADGLIIASPIYWFTMSAQTKLFIDRLYAFKGPRDHGLKGKNIGIILTYAGADPFDSGAVNALRSFQDMFNYLSMPITGTVYGSAEKAGEIAANKVLMKEAFDLGVSVAGG